MQINLSKHQIYANFMENIPITKNMKTFSLIAIGQIISLMGSVLTSFSLAVWIYVETGQATPFAITALFATLPRVLLSPVAGAFADRYNRRRIMIIADSVDALTTHVIARQRT